MLLAKKGPSLPAALWADLRAEYDRNLSNAVYEESIQTNYRAFSAYAGLQLELR